jgi:DNA processing protein
MRQDVTDWVALNLVRGIGPRTANLLIDRFGTPSQIFAAARLDLEACDLKPATVHELHNSDLLERAAAEVERVDQLGGRLITRHDHDYPPSLNELFDPPIVLYVRGDLQTVLARPCLAVVGSRRASTYGMNTAERLSRDLAARGLTIISGLARGIDAAAHRGALEATGSTVAVIGTGIETTYPKEHAPLAAEILERGAIVSEFPLETPPLAQNFPYRNRVLSGLCWGVLVVEAAEHSGSLITARLAAEQGREVFAVPGQITSANSFGPNLLIQDGAKLVQSWGDVVEEFPRQLKEAILGREPTTRMGRPGPLQPVFDEIDLSAGERAVLAKLSPDTAVQIDELLATCGLRSAEVMSALLELEMKDRIKQLPGKAFIKKL